MVVLTEGCNHHELLVWTHAEDAVCAVQLDEVYGEVFRVLKPGGMFCSYEWVATKEFDPNDPEHVRIIDEINVGNGLPVRISGTCALLSHCLAVSML